MFVLSGTVLFVRLSGGVLLETPLCLVVGSMLFCQGLFWFAKDYSLSVCQGLQQCCQGLLCVRDYFSLQDSSTTSHNATVSPLLLPICCPQVASVACRLLKEDASVCNPNHTGTSNFGSKIHSFCIGLEGSPDLAAAKTVADFLGMLQSLWVLVHVGCVFFGRFIVPGTVGQGVTT